MYSLHSALQICKVGTTVYMDTTGPPSFTSPLKSLYPFLGYSVFELNNVASMLDPEDVDLEILIASLAGSLSRGQRAKLAILLGKLVPMLKIPSSISDPTVSPTGEHTPSISPPTRDSPTGQKSESLSITPPTTPALFRSRFMEGKFAILPNLPHPSIRMVDDHAYVSLKQIVSDFFVHYKNLGRKAYPPALL